MLISLLSGTLPERRYGYNKTFYEVLVSILLNRAKVIGKLPADIVDVALVVDVTIIETVLCCRSTYKFP